MLHAVDRRASEAFAGADRSGKMQSQEGMGPIWGERG